MMERVFDRFLEWAPHRRLLAFFSLPWAVLVDGFALLDCRLGSFCGRHAILLSQLGGAVSLIQFCLWFTPSWLQRILWGTSPLECWHGACERASGPANGTKSTSTLGAQSAELYAVRIGYQLGFLDFIWACYVWVRLGAAIVTTMVGSVILMVLRWPLTVGSLVCVMYLT